MNWIVFLIVLVMVCFTGGCVDKTEKVVTPATTETTTPTVTVTPTATVTPTTPPVTPTPLHEPQTYYIFIDSYHGFSKIRHISDKPCTGLDPRNLNVYAGDTVIWRNDDKDYRLDIVSNEGLWDPVDGVLMWIGKEFSYTFKNRGVYTVRISNYPKTADQTINVSE